jgi:hypothetical protein
MDWLRAPFGICPQCGEDKFIGHGPLCGDCYSKPDAFYEDARQEALTESLGQVQCPSEDHWLLDIKGDRCARCMAVL